MAQISDEVKAFFVADTSGLVEGANRAKKVMGELKRSYSEKVSTIKGTILDPGSLVGRGADKLMQSMKLSAVTAGALGAGITIAGEAMATLRDEAAAAKKELEGVNDSTLGIIKLNSRTSSAQGSGELVSRLTAIREQEKLVREKAADLNPTSFLEKYALHYRYNSNYGLIHGDDYLALDRERNRSQGVGLASQAARISGQIPKALRDQTENTKERLSGSSHTADIAELRIAKEKELLELQSNGYANTKENQKAIADRYDAQIAAAKELQRVDDRRFELASRLQGVERSLISDEMRRVRAGELNAANLKEQISSGYNISEEKRRSLQIELMGAERTLEVARAESRVAESQNALAKKGASIQATNASSAAKQYSTEVSTLSALREQLDALKGINTTRSRSLELSIAEKENAVRGLRQDLNFGKSPTAIQERIRKEREDEIKRNKFDQRQDRDDGLINARRDMSGNITGGIDAITGKYRDVTRGYGMAEQGLSGGLNKENGLPGLMTGTLDSYGGTGSIVPPMFTESSAAAHLRGATGAAERLASLRGDPAHDPAARLKNGVIFPDLKKSMASEFARPSTMAGIAGTIGAAKAMSSSRTFTEATAKISAQQLTQQTITNQLMERVISGLGTLALH